MKALITGANGFIGSYVTEALINKGYEVKCLVRKTSNLQWLLPIKDKIQFVYGDINDKSSLYEAVKGVEYVYHIGALIKARDPQSYYQVNYIGTKNLIEVIKEVNPGLKKFIFLSSLAATGPSRDDQCVNEDTPCHPISDYGKSKLQAEELFKNSFMNSIPIVIIRPPIIYGPRDKGFYFYFQVLKSRIIPVLEKKVSICFVRDLVDGVILAGESEKACGQIYFISDDQVHSTEEMGETISKAMGIKAVKIKIPDWLILTVGFFSEAVKIFSKSATIFNRQKARELTNSYWICDISKAKRELGFRPRFSFNEGIKITVDWYVKNGWL